MPVKRRSTKLRRHKITAEARAIWASGRKEMICLTTGGAGMVADEALADALGLPAFIVFPDMADLAEQLSENPTTLDGAKHAKSNQLRKT